MMGVSEHTTLVAVVARVEFKRQHAKPEFVLVWSRNTASDTDAYTVDSFDACCGDFDDLVEQARQDRKPIACTALNENGYLTEQYQIVGRVTIDPTTIERVKYYMVLST